MVKTKSSKIITIFAYIILAVGGFLMLYPFLFSFLGSLLTIEEYMNISLFPLPKGLNIGRFENLILFFKDEFIVSSIGITLIRTAFYMITNIFFGMLGGYIFAKINFKGKKLAFYYFMISMMMPGVIMLLPSFIMFARWPLIGGNNILGQGGSGFIGNWSVLFVSGWFGAYNIFLIRQSIYDIGAEIGESASIDGASNLRIVFMIYFPLLRPVLAVIMIGLFIGQWNDYLFPMTFMVGTETPQLIPIGYRVFSIIADAKGPTVTTPDYPAVFGVCFTSMLVPIWVFVILQKQFISGLTMGSVKG